MTPEEKYKQVCKLIADNKGIIPEYNITVKTFRSRHERSFDSYLREYLGLDARACGLENWRPKCISRLAEHYKRFGVRPSIHKHKWFKNDHLRSIRYGINIYDLYEEAGLPRPASSIRTLESSRNEIMTFIKEKGRLPQKSKGDINYNTLDSWLRRRDSSISSECNQLGISYQMGAKGTANAGSLSISKILEIRRLLASNTTIRDSAKRAGVGHTSVIAIKGNKHWSSVLNDRELRKLVRKTGLLK